MIQKETANHNSRERTTWEREVSAIVSLVPLMTYSLPHRRTKTTPNVETYSPASWALTPPLVSSKVYGWEPPGKLEVSKMWFFLVIVKHEGTELGLRCNFAPFLSFIHWPTTLGIHPWPCQSQSRKVPSVMSLTMDFFLWHSSWARRNLLVASLRS